MYRLLRESLPRTMIVSVGHRSSLLRLHTTSLDVLEQGEWRLRELPRALQL